MESTLALGAPKSIPQDIMEPFYKQKDTIWETFFAASTNVTRDDRYMSKAPVTLPTYDGKDRSKFLEYWKKLKNFLALEDFKRIRGANYTSLNKKSFSQKLYIIVMSKLTITDSATYQENEAISGKVIDIFTDLMHQFSQLDGSTLTQSWIYWDTMVQADYDTVKYFNNRLHLHMKRLPFDFKDLFSNLRLIWGINILCFGQFF